MPLTRSRFEDWLRRYEVAWRSPGTEVLGGLFTADASYRGSPFRDPVVGLDAIGEMWESEREGPDEPFEMSSEIVAVEGDTGVARVHVDYTGPPPREYRDLWIARFAETGGCREFEEWPFWPGQPLAAPAADG